MPEKKRQHYVPRFVLKRFSTDGKRLAVYLLEERRLIDMAGLRDQCYADYFYGTDGELENAFAKEEGAVSRLLGDLTAEGLESLEAEELHRIRLFVHYQLQRTQKAATGVNEWNDTLAKALVSQMPQSEGLDLDKFKFGYKAPQIASLQIAAETVPIILDLAVKFIIATRRASFVLSDHPVCEYNQYAEQDPVLSAHSQSTGLASKGLQLFFPVSPRCCIALYDPSAYAYGSPRSLLCKAGSRDVDNLNQLQALSADFCLYSVPGQHDYRYLDELAKVRAANLENLGPVVSISPVRKLPDGKMSQLLFTEQRRARLSLGFSFAKVIDHTNWSGYPHPCLPPRSWDMIDFVKKYSEWLKSDERKEIDRQRRMAEAAEKAKRGSGTS